MLTLNIEVCLEQSPSLMTCWTNYKATHSRHPYPNQVRLVSEKRTRIKNPSTVNTENFLTLFLDPQEFMDDSMRLLSLTLKSLAWQTYDNSALDETFFYVCWEKIESSTHVLQSTTDILITLTCITATSPRRNFSEIYHVVVWWQI